MPKSFKATYPSTRVVIDCTELYIEMASSVCSQSATVRKTKLKWTSIILIYLCDDPRHRVNRKRQRKKNGTGLVECVFCLSDDIDIGVYIYIKIVSFFLQTQEQRVLRPSSHLAPLTKDETKCSSERLVLICFDASPCHHLGHC